MIYPWFSGNSAHSHTVTSRVSMVLASTVWQAGPRSRTDALGREVMGWGPSKHTGTGGLAAALDDHVSSTGPCCLWQWLVRVGGPVLACGCVP